MLSIGGLIKPFLEEENHTVVYASRSGALQGIKCDICDINSLKKLFREHRCSALIVTAGIHTGYLQDALEGNARESRVNDLLWRKTKGAINIFELCKLNLAPKKVIFTTPMITLFPADDLHYGVAESCL